MNATVIVTLVSVPSGSFSCKMLHLPGSELHNTEQFMMT
jgi:hypothetical protein